MNIEYVYLQLYRLFDKSTPIAADCGKLCGERCCRGDDCGMYLFPGEERVFRLLNPEWAEIGKSDFCYEFRGKKKSVPILFCRGGCDRYQRPLACRIFPLTPYINDEKKTEIIIDPRAKAMCPLAKSLEIDEFDIRFVKNVKRAFALLMKNQEIAEYMKSYSEYLKEYKKFFKE